MYCTIYIVCSHVYTLWRNTYGCVSLCLNHGIVSFLLIPNPWWPTFSYCWWLVPTEGQGIGLFFLSFPFERFCMETSLSINRHCSKNKQWMLRRSNAWVLKGLADYEEKFISVSSICQCSVFPDSLNHLLPEFNQPKTCLIAFARFLHLTSSLFK